MYQIQDFNIGSMLSMGAHALFSTHLVTSKSSFKYIFLTVSFKTKFEFPSKCNKIRMKEFTQPTYT